MRAAALMVLLVSVGRVDASPTVTVHFSPHGGCTDDVVALVRSAKKTVRQSAYAYTSVAISAALQERQRAGVDVQLVIDSSYADRPVPRALKSAGVSVWKDAKHAIMHDKYVVVDDLVVETGSFNYSVAAENSNAENCLVIRDADVARAFADDWERHRSHSRRM